MYRLIGKKVRNEQLGDGIITNAEDTKNGIIITVKFPTEEKRYGFPTALGKALSSDDLELQRIAEEIKKGKEESLNNAEENRKAEEEKALREKSRTALENAEELLKTIDRKRAFGPVEPGNYRFFKVHQGKTFDIECKGGYVWAPKSGVHHHEKMTEIHPGDIIFHYADGALVAVGEALGDCFDFPQPSALYGHGWGAVGYRVEVRYQLLSSPFSLHPYRTNIIANKNSAYSSFNKNGDACEGYMYELEYDLAKFFKSGILSTCQPAGVITVLDRIR